MICLSISTYYLFEFQDCKPNAELCKPLTMLPVLMLLVPGLMVFVAGIVSYSIKRIAFWKSQLAMIILISIYYSLFIAFVFMAQD